MMLNNSSTSKYIVIIFISFLLLILLLLGFIFYDATVNKEDSIFSTNNNYNSNNIRYYENSNIEIETIIGRDTDNDNKYEVVEFGLRKDNSEINITNINIVYYNSDFCYHNDNYTNNNNTNNNNTNNNNTNNNNITDNIEYIHNYNETANYDYILFKDSVTKELSYNSKYKILIYNNNTYNSNKFEIPYITDRSNILYT